MSQFRSAALNRNSDGLDHSRHATCRSDPNVVPLPIPRRWLFLPPIQTPQPESSTSPSIALPAAARSLETPPDKSHTPASSVEFQLVSYNLLAQCLIRRDLFPYCSNRALKSSVRKELILNELLSFLPASSPSRPDVFAFQELDDDLYHQYYSKNLAKFGYNGEFASRKSGAKHGCAFFYNSKKWSVLKHEVIFFPDLLKQQHGSHPLSVVNLNGAQSNVPEIADLSKAERTNDDGKNLADSTNFSSFSEELSHPNIAQFLALVPCDLIPTTSGSKFASHAQLHKSSAARRKLQHKARQEETDCKGTTIENDLDDNASSSSEQQPDWHCGIVLVNTHLHWNPKYGLTRLCQSHLLLSHVHKFIQSLSSLASVSAMPSIDWNVFFAGDYNTTPDHGIFEFLTCHTLSESEYGWFTTPKTSIRNQRSNVQKDKESDKPQTKVENSENEREPEGKTNTSAASTSLSAPTASAAPKSKAVVDSDGHQDMSRDWNADWNSFPNSLRMQFIQSILQDAKSLPYLHSVYSAYESVIPNDKQLAYQRTRQTKSWAQQHAGHPAFTTYTQKWKGHLDYIFQLRKSIDADFKSNTFEIESWSGLSVSKCIALLEIPSEEEIRGEKGNIEGLPDERFGSDHLSIAAKFLIRPK